VSVERGAHRGDVGGCRAATAADDASTGIADQAGVVGHQLGGAVVDDAPLLPGRDPAVGLGHEYRSGVRRSGGTGEVGDRRDDLGRTHPAVAADGGDLDAESADHAERVGGRETHHRASVGVDADGADDRQPESRGAADRRFDLLGRGQRLEPEKIDPSPGERRCLLGEGLAGGRDADRAVRLEDLAGRSHRAGDQHVAAAPGAV